MTIREIKKEYAEKSNRIKAELSKVEEEKKTKLRERLEEVNLIGMVKRKANGHIGKLHIGDGWPNIKFYPLTKKGEISKREESFSYGGDIEDMFEPYNESEVEK